MTIRPLHAIALACSLFAASAHAVYPDKPIRLVVPWAPGGSTDAVARAVAQRMTETMGQSVVVDNRSGASGRIGTELAAKALPDGYTINVVELPHAIAPAVFVKMPYDLLKDFAPVSMLGTSPLMLFANASQYKTGDAKAFLQNSRTAGGPIALAHSGNGSISHLSAELMSSATGVKVTAIPYRGSAPALTDVAAGLVVGHFSTLASASALLTAGKVSALMVTGSSRLGSMPDVPTTAESGIPGMQFNQWWALVAPAATPPEILDRLNKEVVAALAHPAVRERLTTLGIDLKGSTREALGTFMRNEVAHWGAVVHKAGITPE